MKNRTALLALPLLVFGLLLAGCDSGSSEDSLIGTYSLIRIGGEPLPVQVGDYPSDQCSGGIAIIEIENSSLTLDDDATYQGQGVVNIECQSGENIDTQESTATGTYTVTGNEIRFIDDDSGNVFSGIKNGERIIIEEAYEEGAAIYEKD